MPKVFRDGKWTEGKASPELLRPELRELPANRLTKDIDDPDRIHALDSPHIVAALNDEITEREADERIDPLGKRTLDYGLPGPGEAAPLSQRLVYRRIAMMYALTWEIHFERRWKEFLQSGRWKPEVQHLWFPEDNINHYTTRPGHAPENKRRPKFMRGLYLDFDLLDPPKPVHGFFAEYDIELPDFPGMISWAKRKAEHEYKMAMVAADYVREDGVLTQ